MIKLALGIHIVELIIRGLSSADYWKTNIYVNSVDFATQTRQCTYRAGLRETLRQYEIPDKLGEFIQIFQYVSRSAGNSTKKSL